MARQYAAQPGNYLAFFSSFDYLQKALADCSAQRHPAGAGVGADRARMDEAARERSWRASPPRARASASRCWAARSPKASTCPGERLIGAFIATLGLPQVNPVNEQMKQRMGESFGAGQATTTPTCYPGLQKVVQAAGRVIRTHADRGVICLIDDRFARPEVRRLLPRWWQVGQIRVFK